LKALQTIDYEGCHCIIHGSFLPSGYYVRTRIQVQKIKAAFEKGIYMLMKNGLTNKRVSEMKNVYPESVSRASKTKR
jgi:hypothetical protein